MAQGSPPAFAGELLRRRCQRIRHRTPDIGTPITIEVDGVFVEFGREELREPHGAAPRGTQIRARHPVLQHLQGMQKFVVEEILALADIGLGRKHADSIVRKLIPAVIGLARPDRQHDVPRYAEFLFDARQRIAILRGELPSARCETIEARLPQILRRRLHEFGLLRLLLGTSRDGEIGQRIVRLQAARCGIECRA
jgi:hypothetical protein